MKKIKQILFGDKKYSCQYDPDGSDDPDNDNITNNLTLNQKQADDWYQKMITNTMFTGKIADGERVTELMIPENHTVKDIDDPEEIRLEKIKQKWKSLPEGDAKDLFRILLKEIGIS